MKTQLLRHTDCNRVLVHKSIAREAQKFVDGLLSYSSAFHTNGVSPNSNYGNPSSASTADFLNMYSPEADGIPPAETKPFQQGSRTSEVKEDVFGLSLELSHTTPVPPDSMVSAHPLSGMSLIGYGPDLYSNMGPQEHQADEIGWKPHWSIDDTVTAISY